jgi:hypothetical protein
MMGKSSVPIQPYISRQNTLDWFWLNIKWIRVQKRFFLVLLKQIKMEVTGYETGNVECLAHNLPGVAL